MALVAPSLLSLNFADAAADLKRVNSAKTFHYDVMDGHFVPNISFGPGILKQLKPFINNVSVHLMVSNPEKIYKSFIGLCEALTIHVEVIKDESLIQEIKKVCSIGISLNPNTPIEALLPYLSLVNHVLVMSVEPGFGGQKFIESAFQKVAFLDKYRRDHQLNYHIEVDGGVNTDNGRELEKLGADILVMGSFLFNSTNPGEIIKAFKKR